MLDMTGNTISVSLFNESEPQRFELNIANGLWHHLCYQWSSGQHGLYVDGIISQQDIYGEGSMMPKR